MAAGGGRAARRVVTRDVLLMTLTFSSGAVDAISFLALGKVFTAFMTGNLVFLGLGLADAFGSGGPDLTHVGAAVAAFAVGVAAATEIVKRSRRSRLWTRGASLVLGGVLVAEGIFMAGWGIVGGHPSATFATWLAILAALAMGMQSAAVASLGVGGVFTTAATATVIYLSRDVAERPKSAAEPRRLAGVLVALLAGATAGGLLLAHAPQAAALVPPVATVLAIGLASAIEPAQRSLAADVPL